MMGAGGLTAPLRLPRDQRLHVGRLEFRFRRGLVGILRYVLRGRRRLMPRRDDAYPVGAGAVLGFQEDDDELLRGVVLGHDARDVPIILLLDRFLVEVCEGVARAGQRLARDVDDDGAPPLFLERKGGDRREGGEVLDTDVVYPHPAEIPLALSLCPVWYVVVFGCHMR